ncbi:MAG TPA: TRAP transporter substrate-binding protein DctP [Bryobacteraceae bacterium]|jgi:TRAP-type transport system periplasmic protein|nr:TRAP transporter substrate-binding protein DctP [Bryobacteraceae bacterium]
MLLMVRVALLSVLLSASLSAQTIIRLGTLVPKGSRWHEILLNMGEEWKKASGGKVELKIYPGGEQGDEPEMVQKLRIKKLQAVALSGAGLSGIDAAVAALQIPMMLSSYDEVDYVRDRISERLEKGLAQRGFIVLNWGDAGWIHFFTKQPASRPEEIRRMKLCVLQGDNSTFELYKINGFQPVSLAATDILTGLQTGLIDAFQAPPLVALSNQWFGGAKNMLDVPFAELVGATVISKDVWDTIPAPVQKEMMQSAHTAGIALREEIRKSEASSIPLMQQFGLNVVHADPKAVAEWRALAEGIWPKLRGQAVPADLFDQVKRLRDEYRKTHHGAVVAAVQ